MKVRPALLLLAIAASGAVALAACGRTGLDPLEGDGLRIPQPFGFPDLQEFPDPTPTPRFGSGADGDAVIDSNQYVNACSVLVATTGQDGVLVDFAGFFAPTNRVLLLQVHGRTSTSGDQAPIAALDSAGQWQVSEVVAVQGTSLQLSPGPAFGFRSDASSRAQICRMPQFGNVTVNPNAVLGSLDWDGSTGGVMAFFVSSTLTLSGNALVEAFNDGFKGGAFQLNGNTTGITASDTTQPNGGRKGEGLDRRSASFFGRGNYANGAGGGNGSDAGGAGGGNGGAGGSGGREFAGGGGGGGNASTGGLGGAVLAASLDSRMLFGGGGGAGHSNGGLNSSGGSGGGLVLVFARSLAGTGVISADGLSGFGLGAMQTDGGGGGGAGGTVRLEVETSVFTGAIVARGGNGGSVAAGHGPGGGGGGGRIRLMGISTAGLSALSAREGQSGTANGQGARGALNGLPGVVVTSP